MRSFLGFGKQDRYDVQFTSGFEERLILEVQKRMSNQLILIQQRLASLQVQLDRMEKKQMATAAELQAQMDGLKAEVQRNTDIDASIKAALDGQIAMIAELQAQIQALQAAGAAAMTQEQLDALSTQASDTLATLRANNDDLAAKVTANT